MVYPKKLKRLIENLCKLPGIGPKMAERLAHYILKMNEQEIEELADSIKQVKTSVKLCSICYCPTEEDICSICRDESRDRTTICVVKNMSALNAVERTKKYNGLYHVLDKIVAPLDGMSPEKERIEKLLERVSNGVKEVIIATDTDAEGEMTSNYLAEYLKKKKVKVTRLGYGMPVGGALEYADEITLGRSLEGRKEI